MTLSGKTKWLLAISFVIVTAVATSKPAWKSYQKWKEHRLVAAAQRNFASGQLREAGLISQQILSFQPTNAPALRIMAALSDLSGSPNAVSWWERACRADPNSLQNHLDWGAAALRSGHLPLAREALSQAPESRNKSSEYFELHALVALAGRRYRDAEDDLLRAVTLNPKNTSALVNLASVRLNSTNAAASSAAKIELRAIPANSRSFPAARRALAEHAIQRESWNEALENTRLLASSTNAPLSDELLHLSALKQSTSPEFAPYFEAMREKAGTNSNSAHSLASWMKSSLGWRPALQWVRTLPLAIQNGLPLPLLTADCFIEAKDWPALGDFLRSQKNWGEFEYLRHATLARALREQEADWITEWRAALQTADDRPGTLSSLGSLVASWGWDGESEEVLWTLVKVAPSEHWPLASLYEHYQKTRNTLGLHKIFARLIEAAPDDLVAKNNFAILSLLLDVQIRSAHEFADKVHFAEPANPLFACTYAYSQYLRGHTERGLEAMAKLSDDQLKNPATALYYAVLLKAAGRTSEAQKYLTTARTGKLLPEEEELVKETARGLTVSGG
jgi:Flp pilus assembly protein TadD